jgi:hypothetical protein
VGFISARQFPCVRLQICITQTGRPSALNTEIALYPWRSSSLMNLRCLETWTKGVSGDNGVCAKSHGECLNWHWKEMDEIHHRDDISHVSTLSSEFSQMFTIIGCRGDSKIFVPAARFLRFIPPIRPLGTKIQKLSWDFLRIEEIPIFTGQTLNFECQSAPLPFKIDCLPWKYRYSFYLEKVYIIPWLSSGGKGCGFRKWEMETMKMTGDNWEDIVSSKESERLWHRWAKTDLWIIGAKELSVILKYMIPLVHPWRWHH